MCVCGHDKGHHFDTSYNDDLNVASDDYEEPTEFCFECSCEQFNQV